MTLSNNGTFLKAKSMHSKIALIAKAEILRSGNLKTIQNDPISYTPPNHSLKREQQYMNVRCYHTGATMTTFAEEERANYMNQLNVKIQSLADIHELPCNEQRTKMDNFMDSVRNLYLNYFYKDLQAAQQCAQGNRQTLESVRLLALGYLRDLDSFITMPFEGFGGEWEVICSQRTNVEAYNEMFGEVIRKLDTSEVEQDMQDIREKAECPGIPKNMPKSHWWWWAGIPEGY